MAEQVAAVVDAKGKACPMPVLMTRKGITGIESGQLLRVESTDAGSKSDIPSWAKDMGHELISAEQEGDVFVYLIRKK